MLRMLKSMMKMARPLMAPKMVFTFWASTACRWERVSMVSSLRAATRGSRAASTAASWPSAAFTSRPVLKVS